MTDLPRSQALVRLDGPGHILPVEPVTPPDSAAWRVVHFPVTLGLVAIGLLLGAMLAIRLLSVAFQIFSYVPGARYLVPIIAAVVIGTIYWIFARIVERRPRIEEFDRERWWKAIGLSFGGGVALSLAAVAVLSAVGGVRSVSLSPPQAMPLALVVQLGTAVVLEILLRGMAFRLIERLAGSWLALLLTAIGFAVAAMADDGTTPAIVVAQVLQSGLTCAALFMATRRLWAPIGLHAGWAFAGAGLYRATPYGGPDWLTGGGGGLDASLPVIVGSAALVAALIAVAVRRGRIVRPIWRRGQRTTETLSLG